jgi:hypothetical protein
MGTPAALRAGLKHLMLYTDVETLYRWAALAMQLMGAAGLMHRRKHMAPARQAAALITCSCAEHDTSTACLDLPSATLYRVSIASVAAARVSCAWVAGWLQGRAGGIRAGPGLHGHHGVAAGPRRIHAAAPGRHLRCVNVWPDGAVCMPTEGVGFRCHECVQQHHDSKNLGTQAPSSHAWCCAVLGLKDLLGGKAV